MLSQQDPTDSLWRTQTLQITMSAFQQKLPDMPRAKNVTCNQKKNQSIERLRNSDLELVHKNTKTAIIHLIKDFTEYK